LALRQADLPGRGRSGAQGGAVRAPGFDWPDGPDDDKAVEALANQDLDEIAAFVINTWGQGSTDPQTDAITYVLR
jgi:hypothetical protein